MSIDEATEVLETHLPKARGRHATSGQRCLVDDNIWPCDLRTQAASIMAWVVMIGEEAAREVERTRWPDTGDSNSATSKRR